MDERSVVKGRTHTLTQLGMNTNTHVCDWMRCVIEQQQQQHSTAAPFGSRSNHKKCNNNNVHVRRTHILNLDGIHFHWVWCSLWLNSCIHTHIYIYMYIYRYICITYSRGLQLMLTTTTITETTTTKHSRKHPIANGSELDTGNGHDTHFRWWRWFFNHCLILWTQFHIWFGRFVSFSLSIYLTFFEMSGKTACMWKSSALTHMFIIN